jgi:hypothetical protein
MRGQQNIIHLLLLWRYRPGWALASNTILQSSRSLALSLHSFIPILLRSVHTSSSHLVFGLPLRLVAYSFPYIFQGIAVSRILSLCPSHRIQYTQLCLYYVMDIRRRKHKALITLHANGPQVAPYHIQIVNSRYHAINGAIS